jgi:DAPG hydrolase PhiG domain
MAEIEIPAPRPVLWPLRPAASAEHGITRRDGQTIITIRHAPLRGVTPEMLGWWYRHVPGMMPYAGRTHPRYLVWHPLDHISYQLTKPGRTGGVSPGAHLHITEALHRDPDNLLDIRVAVEEIDEGRAAVARQVLGTSVVRLENEFTAARTGAAYVTRMTIGDDTALGWVLLNRIAHRRAFPPQRIQPWVRHHVEEIGNLENLLPDLFEARSSQEP